MATKKSHEQSTKRALRKKVLAGLLEYKPRWGLTMQAWLIFLFLFILSLSIVLFYIHPFLALSEPINAEALIIEGWADDIVIEGAVTEFNQGQYKFLITSGGPLGKGTYLSEFKSFADLAAATVIALNVPKEQIITISSPFTPKDRTAASAKAVKDWIAQSSTQIKTVNIYSYDAHTRRSWWIFKTVLEPEIKVGAIAHPSLNYDSTSWFTSSAGVRSVVSETIAFLYARFIWHK